MKRRAGLAIAAVVFLGAAAAEAQDFGLGLVLGEPTGVSWKWWQSSRGALAGALAWSLDDDRLHINVDYLVHQFGDIRVREGRMAWYYGIGGRLNLRHNRNRFGVRVPLGLDYTFERAPIDIFLEIAPTLELVPETDVDFDAVIGARYFF